MKTSIVLLTLLVAGSLAAEQPKAKTVDHSAKAVPVTHESAAVTLPGKPNEIIGKRYTYSGVAVQFVKAKTPLELVNPLAPPEYGYGDANLNQDIITGKPTVPAGFNFFSIKF